MSTVTIIDVGHGNSSVIEHEGKIAILDGGRGRSLVSYLEKEGISEIHALLISHGDADHIGGLTPLLVDDRFTVRYVYANCVPLKRTKVWDELREALGNAIQRGTQVIGHLQTTTNINYFDTHVLKIDVISPTGMTTLTASDAYSATSNSVSAVLRVLDNGQPFVLLASDMNAKTLKDISDRRASIAAPVIIFPHHGGLPGGYDAKNFARELCETVEPNFVIFSLGRDAKNPKPEIITGVRESRPDAYIACTQLSKHCSDLLPGGLASHLASFFAHGKDDHYCCAGTIRLEFSPSGIINHPLTRDHQAFVDTIPNPLCRRNIGSSTSLPMHDS